MQEPCKRYLHGSGVKTRGHIGQGPRLQWAKPAKRKERHVGDTVPPEVRDEGIVGPMRQVVMILDANDRDNPSRFRDLRVGDRKETDGSTLRDRRKASVARK